MSIKPRTIKPFSYGLLALGLALLLGSTEAVGAQSDAEQVDSSSQVESLATSSESVSSLSESQVGSASSENLPGSIWLYLYQRSSLYRPSTSGGRP